MVLLAEMEVWTEEVWAEMQVLAEEEVWAEMQVLAEEEVWLQKVWAEMQMFSKKVWDERYEFWSWTGL